MKLFSFLVGVTILLSACTSIGTTNQYTVHLVESGNTFDVNVSAGSTVRQSLDVGKINLGLLDRTEPAVDSLVTDGQTIRIIRVTEEFENQESVLPFEQQTVNNESLPEGQTVLIQPGTNGVIQSTYRIVKEDGIEVSRTLVKTEVTIASKPEITMIGIQSPFSVHPITGVLAYLTSSNAWIIENNTGNRRPVVTTGDLDGRIFTLSPDGKWLLFSRAILGQDKLIINSLWVINLKDPDSAPVDTDVRNVVHYADWVPGKIRTIAYSTVESRSTSPGWQANNDLFMLSLDEKGHPLEKKLIIDTNSGGLYGWWGSTYQWSPDGSKIAYSRPDSIGIVNIKTGDLNPLIEYTPYQPTTDWAYFPTIFWSYNSEFLFSVVNDKKVDPSSAQDNAFDLIAISLEAGQVYPLVQNCGLFCYPVPSSPDNQGDYLIGYLSSTLPERSESSMYAIKVMDKDGSNQTKLFPNEGSSGVKPQIIEWSPSSAFEDATIAFIDQGNLIFTNISSTTVRQITGDGTISKISWR